MERYQNFIQLIDKVYSTNQAKFLNREDFEQKKQYLQNRSAYQNIGEMKHNMNKMEKDNQNITLGINISEMQLSTVQLEMSRK